MLQCFASGHPLFLSPPSANKSMALAVIPIAHVRRMYFVRQCFRECFLEGGTDELLPWHI